MLQYSQIHTRTFSRHVDRKHKPNRFSDAKLLIAVHKVCLSAVSVSWFYVTNAYPNWNRVVHVIFVAPFLKRSWSECLTAYGGPASKRVLTICYFKMWKKKLCLSHCRANLCFIPQKTLWESNESMGNITSGETEGMANAFNKTYVNMSAMTISSFAVVKYILICRNNVTRCEAKQGPSLIWV